MHQFILYGNIPLARHEQVMNIMAGVAAMQPVAYAEQHIIYEPCNRAVTADTNLINTKRKTPLNGNQQRYYNDVNREIDYKTHAATSDWKLLIKEEPEAGSPNFISQPYTSFDEVSLQKYRDPAGFKYIDTQVWAGHFFVHGNVVVRLWRVLVPKTDIEDPLDKIPPKREELKVLDPSGAYLIEACVRVEDRQNSKIADAATKELLDLQKFLVGAIPLSAPDRLSLDTRVKNTE